MLLREGLDFFLGDTKYNPPFFGRYTKYNPKQQTDSLTSIKAFIRQKVICNRVPTPTPITKKKETHHRGGEVGKKLTRARPQRDVTSHRECTCSPLSPTLAPVGEHTRGRTERTGSRGQSWKLKGHKHKD